MREGTDLVKDFSTFILVSFIKIKKKLYWKYLIRLPFQVLLDLGLHISILCEIEHMFLKTFPFYLF